MPSQGFDWTKLEVTGRGSLTFTAYLLQHAARGTLYGKGIYFAECATKACCVFAFPKILRAKAEGSRKLNECSSGKADEYCVEDADGYCWMLLCRVALGTVMVCKEPAAGSIWKHLEFLYQLVISYHIISYHIISYHIISYQIIYI